MKGEVEHGEGGFLTFDNALTRAVDAAWLARDIAITTESPIEAIFGIAAAKEFSSRESACLPEFTFVRCEQGQAFPQDHILMMPQFWWRNYRVDWVFQANFLEQLYVFVECDGRAFHSSDEQLIRDSARDAAMRAAGIRVMRFSGRDIYKNASLCAVSVFWEIEAQYKLERGK